MSSIQLKLFPAVRVVAILIVLMTSLTVASATRELATLELKFVQVINKINRTLEGKKQVFKSSKHQLAEFVDETLLPIWSSGKTVKGLFGSKIWGALTVNEQKALEAAFNNTLQRYVQEGFDYYDGQKIEFIKLALNRKKTKGFLTVKIIPKVLPNFTIDLKIGRIEEHWYFYDVYVKGVSYISLKKDGYRNHFRDHGIQSVLTEMEEKNLGFIASSFSR